LGAVPYNFQDFDRDQIYLLPPSITEWLPEDHLAYFLIEVVDGMNLSAFYAEYREDGWGGSAHHPKMMVALLLYAYCVGVRSSRQIERACRYDIAFRVICAAQTPDHTTVARFRQRHEQALAGVFKTSLQLCYRAGLAKVGVVALDGTKIAGRASVRANQTKDTIDAEVERMLREAEALDASEDARFGEGSGEAETPAHLRGRKDRQQRLAQAKREIDAELQAEQASHEAYLTERAAREQSTGKKVSGRKPLEPKQRRRRREPKRNTSDPESRLMMGLNGGILQGYNAQAVANQEQVIVAAAVTNEQTDARQLLPMIEEVTKALGEAGIDEKPGVWLADAGYASEANFEGLPEGLEAYVATRNMYRKEGFDPTRPGSLRAEMERKVLSEAGREVYSKRGELIEPVFGQLKEGLGFRRFSRLGQGPADAEWKFLAGVHNLLKLYRRRQERPRAEPGKHPTGAGEHRARPLLAAA
jgi:transposase